MDRRVFVGHMYFAVTGRKRCCGIVPPALTVGTTVVQISKRFGGNLSRASGGILIIGSVRSPPRAGDMPGVVRRRGAVWLQLRNGRILICSRHPMVCIRASIRRVLWHELRRLGCTHSHVFAGWISISPGSRLRSRGRLRARRREHALLRLVMSKSETRISRVLRRWRCSVRGHAVMLREMLSITMATGDRLSMRTHIGRRLGIGIDDGRRQRFVMEGC